MKLTKIEIENFRSIKKAEIEIKHNCLILVGKNEAGKSNILKALAGGLKAYPITNKDLRKRTPSEKHRIRYHLTIEKNDFDKFKILSSNRPILIITNNEKVTLSEFVLKYSPELVYECNLDEKSISFKIFDNNIPTNLYLQRDVMARESLTKEKLLEFINVYLRDFFEVKLPKVILWEYKDNLFLPDSIDIEEFKNSPNISEPFKNIFKLAGYKDIKKDIQISFDSNGDYHDLVKDISQKITAIFRSKWPDLKNIKITLAADRNEIKTKIEETALYNFGDRSDGFRRFMSILLMLSCRVENKEIENAIILIDEPDTSLYPTGAKYLRDELLKIAEQNVVIYSTHSPFMIDKKNIGRHIIVEKKDEITHCNFADETSWKSDEVLLNSIGTSQYEHLKEKNLIFEGWTDLEILNKIINSSDERATGFKTFFKSCGMTAAHGAQSIKDLISIIKLCDKSIYIFTDSDSSARSAQKEHKNSNGYAYNHWYTIQDLGGLIDQEVEDYITDETLFKKALEHIGRTDLDITTRGNKTIMKFLEGKLTKDQKTDFKVYIASNVTVDKIKSEYFYLLEKLKNNMEAD